MLDRLQPVVIITGHYGTGKTNFALNLALDCAAQGERVILCDLDIVNPYFRSSEYRELLEASGVELIAPVFAERGSSLDVPSLRGTIATAIEAAQAGSARCIIDCGGDDAGSAALGRFAALILQGGYDLLYVVNRFRNLTQHPDEAAHVLSEIEACTGIPATAVVNNSHLMDETTASVLMSGQEFAEQIAALRCLPLLCTTVPKWLVEGENPSADGIEGLCAVYPVSLYVKTPWKPDEKAGVTWRK